MTINGPGASVITISGDNAFRIFYVNAGVNFNLNNLTVANGNSTGQPPALAEGHAGGIYSLGNMTISNSVFTGNGGGAVHSNGSMTLVNSTITGNDAKVSAGVANGGTMTIIGTTISDNVASLTARGDNGNGEVGGLDNWGILTVINSTIVNNQAVTGGGVYNTNAASDLTMINSTVANNTASSAGNNFYVAAGRVTVRSTIITNSSGLPNCNVALRNGGFNIQYPGTDCHSDIAVGDPHLGPLQDNGGPTWTMALLPGSAAIDADNISTCAEPPINGVDQRGFARLIDGDGNGVVYCDVGAFEAPLPPPDVFTVTKLADTNDGVCNTDCSLREAVNKSTIGSTIIFATGLQGTITLNPVFDYFPIKKNLTIIGPGTNKMTLSGNNQVRVFGVENPVTFNLSGVTIAYGRALSGGAININAGSSVTLNNTVLRNNVSYYNGVGGGNGGAIVNVGSLTIIDSVISNNSAHFTGGGIHTNGPLTVINTTVNSNSAQNGGGGIYSHSGPLTIANSTIQGNVITNTAVYVGGGGLYVGSSDEPTITNSTIASNSGVNGSNIFGSNVAVSNTIIANGSGSANCYHTSSSFSPVQDGGNNLQYPGTSCNPTIPVSNPLLGSIGNNGGQTPTLPLIAGSPAIDAGNDTICAAAPINNQDQRGIARPFDGDSNGSAICDVGAFEVSTPQTAAPAATVLFSPSGTSATSLPSFRWRPISGVTSYYLWVRDTTGTVIQQWYRADVSCTTTVCSTTSPVQLQNTAYVWWVQTYSSTGGYGPWSASKSFTVNEPPPPAPLLTVPSGTITTSSPIFRWSKVARATHYVLSVTGPSGSVILQTFAAASVCPTSCSVVSPIKLWNNTYSWQVQGYGVGGYGPWSATRTFTVNEAPPARAVLIAPTTTVNTNHPTFTWNPAVRATNYTLSVKTNAGATVINQVFDGTAICTATLCSASVPSVDLANGGYKWQVQTYGPGGYGTWSLIKAFTVNAAGPVAVPPTRPPVPTFLPSR
jgi:CSLREA domain-containing protein